ncbi:cytochrome c [Ottowia sp.]|uniref:c-type cytochrome n=1 Tax=Ottowia sp. TaxID=1898956 RepID=UPI002C715B73|nr:cytochrome c [Ottowia sp.]HRN75951.1 cytochrome c [Ottowia sp.]HRQ04043.1 cytochrome c [Ottowia sp.]
MSASRRLAVGALLVLVLLAAAVWMRWGSALVAQATSQVLRPDDDALVAIGQRVYTAHCAACHGAQGEGQPNWRERGPDGLLPAPPHDASGHTWHHADAQLFAIVKHGMARVIQQPDYRTTMPIYEGTLSDEEIAAVLSWIKAQWPADVRRHHDQVNAQAVRR